MKVTNLASDYQGLVTKEDNWKAHHWLCTLEQDGRTYTFDYYMGTGLTGQPTLDMVLESLFSDLSLYEEIEDALDLVEHYEFSSKNARETYPKLEENAEGLQHLFGDKLDYVRDYIMEIA